MLRTATNTLQIFILLAVDSIFLLISILGAVLLRFDFLIPIHIFHFLISWFPIILLFKLSIFQFFKLFRGLYRYTSIWDIGNIIKANVLASLVMGTIIFYFQGTELVPPSILVIDLFLSTILIGMNRIGIRLYYSNQLQSVRENKYMEKVKRYQTQVLLVGAGYTGEKIAREILTTRHIQYDVVGFLDDDPRKKGATLHGIKIFGPVSDAKDSNLKYDELLITAPSATGDEMRKLVSECKKLGKPYKTVPGLSEIIDGNVSFNMVREVSYADLLRREEIQLDTSLIDNFIRGKRVLITGAGGSIGSELVRQCLQFKPALLVLFDNSEFNLFSIQQELTNTTDDTSIQYCLGDVRDTTTINKTISEFTPQVILHAAAYKHVPLQESHPWEAVNTNVIGTLNVIDFALKYQVEKFVLVSTDKAVHPVNVMGATKRLAEIMIQVANKLNSTSFIAVRFGNVLGSSGSVIPIFEKQIKSGGPVQITHPDMVRYFMSIPEAAQLIFQASAMVGGRGKIFVLDMGQPIKIKDMAYDLIRLSGYEPEVDIDIVYTGIRRGEKLYEELAFDGEILSKTKHAKIMTLNNDGTSEMDWVKLKLELQSLHEHCKSFDSDSLKIALKQLVPEYIPSK
jgi:FlaA1/EpsC-like NDP-sugar epimerase